MPIPFPLRTVNVHVLTGSDGWALIDTGIGTPAARAAFWEGLQSLGLEIDALQAIVLSHQHPDHVGLSGELQSQSGAKVYMHPLDEAHIHRIPTGTMSERFKHVSQFLQQHGLPPTELWLAHVDPQTVRSMICVPPHEAFTLVQDGAYIDLLGERYRVLWTPGHSDGHICLWRERDGVFLAADHVLPRITPNIGLYSELDRPNPLQDYLNSLEKVRNLPASIVLPGHGQPFADLAGRAREIAEHHTQRLQQIVTLLARKPQHAAQLTAQLFGRRLQNSEAKRMAVAEVLAHLEYLRYAGRVEQMRSDDGLILYAMQ
jgi:glyoxylase-like metal-dependent hydrolase (beta-lactamase superfamily II)